MPTNILTSTTTSAPYTSPTLACPASNGQTYTDSLGVQYIIACVADTNNGGAYANPAAVHSFDDCFYYCSTNYQSPGSNCTTFTYWGGINGVGPGLCFLKTFSPEGFISSDNTHVAAVRLLNYQSASSSARISSSTRVTSSSQTSGSASTASFSTSSSSILSVTTVSSSSSSALSSPIVPPSCPANDGSTYTAGDLSTYLIVCNQDYASVDSPIPGVNAQVAASLVACADLCASQGTQCTGSTWYPSNNTCNLKRAMNPTANAGVLVHSVVRMSGPQKLATQLLSDDTFVGNIVNGLLGPWTSGLNLEGTALSLLNGEL